MRQMSDGLNRLYLIAAALSSTACSGEDVELERSRTTSDPLTAIHAPSPLAERSERLRAYVRNRVSKLNAVATTTTGSGAILDWVPRPGGKARVVAPPRIRDGIDMSSAVQFELEATPQARGPEGTVPYARFDVDAYLAAAGERVPETPAEVFRRMPAPSPSSDKRYHARAQKTDAMGGYTGIYGHINLWNVQLMDGDTSIMQLFAARGLGSQLQSV